MSENSWTTSAIEKATDRLREELDEEERDASGAKQTALQKAREHVDDVEEALKKRS